MTTSRPIRSALTAFLMVVLGGSIVVAQAPAIDGGAAQVQGTSTLVTQLEAGAQSIEEGVIMVRDNVLVTREETDDPRVSGTATITVNSDLYPSDGGLQAAQIRYGRMRLENEDGSWSGGFTGRMSHGAFVQTYWLSGEGAYAGLSYVVMAVGNGPVWRSQGVIYPGAVPPQGGLALPQLDQLGPGMPSVQAPTD